MICKHIPFQTPKSCNIKHNRNWLNVLLTSKRFSKFGIMKLFRFSDEWLWLAKHLYNVNEYAAFEMIMTNKVNEKQHLIKDTNNILRWVISSIIDILEKFGTNITKLTSATVIIPPSDTRVIELRKKLGPYYSLLTIRQRQESHISDRLCKLTSPKLSDYQEPKTYAVTHFWTPVADFMNTLKPEQNAILWLSSLCIGFDPVIYAYLSICDTMPPSSAPDMGLVRVNSAFFAYPKPIELVISYMEYLKRHGIIFDQSTFDNSIGRIVNWKSIEHIVAIADFFKTHYDQRTHVFFVQRTFSIIIRVLNMNLAQKMMLRQEFKDILLTRLNVSQIFDATKTYTEDKYTLSFVSLILDNKSQIPAEVVNLIYQQGLYFTFDRFEERKEFAVKFLTSGHLLPPNVVVIDTRLQIKIFQSRNIEIYRAFVNDSNFLITKSLIAYFEENEYTESEKLQLLSLIAEAGKYDIVTDVIWRANMPLTSDLIEAIDIKKISDASYEQFIRLAIRQGEFYLATKWMESQKFVLDGRTIEFIKDIAHVIPGLGENRKSIQIIRHMITHYEHKLNASKFVSLAEIFIKERNYEMCRVLNTLKVCCFCLIHKFTFAYHFFMNSLSI